MNIQGVKFFIALAMLLPAAVTAESQAQNLSGIAQSHVISYINDSDGLPSNFIDDITKDSYGFMWIATSGGGLCRYDGYEFLTFSTNSRSSIKSNFVRNIATDSYGRLWIGSEGGIDVIDLKTLESLSPDFGEFQDILYSFCSYLTIDSSGRLWFKTDTELYRCDFASDGTVSSILTFSDPRLSQTNMVFKDVDKDGTVWVSLEGEIYKIQESQEHTLSAQKLSERFSIRQDAYLSDFLSNDNEMWISTNDGLYRLNKDLSAWRHYTYSSLDGASLTQDFITCLVQTSDKTLLASSLKGLNIYDPILDSFAHILENEFVNTVYVSDDIIWVGTENSGLVRLSPKRLYSVNYIHDSSDPSSISSNPVNSIVEDPDGRIWVGNVESGLNCLLPSTGKFLHYTHENSGLSHNSVSAMALDSKGRLWIGTWGGGLDVARIDKGFSIVKRFVPQVDMSSPLNYVGLLAFDSLNNIMWIGTNIGMFCYDLDSEELFPALVHQGSGFVGACIDSSGHLWTGGQSGLYVFDLNSRDSDNTLEQFPFVNYRYRLDNPSSRTAEKISCVNQAKDGTMWLGGLGSGLYKAVQTDSGEFEFKNFGASEGLENDMIKGIEEDFEGNLWIATDRGLYSFDTETEKFSCFGENDGILSGRFYWNASYRTSDGRLCLGQVEGLTIIDPSRTYEINPENNLKFTQITVADKVDRNPVPQILELHERDRFINIEFSALNFDVGTRIRYKYRVKGFNDSWNTVPDFRNFISITSLRHGSYLLEIEAFEENQRNVGSISLPIKVAPYFYNTFVFYLAVVLLAIAAVYLYTRHRERNLMRYQQILQKTVDERTTEISQQKKLLELKTEELAGQNLLLKRQNEELASRKILYGPDVKTDEPEGEKFISKLMEVIRASYKDPALDVPTLCEFMGMSKTLFNNKMQSIVGQSAGQFIRTYRLTVAMEMLSYNNSMNISEIAYEVGFNDPKYFTRCFTKEFGFAPSTMLK